jgi:hypothetical protein
LEKSGNVVKKMKEEHDDSAIRKLMGEDVQSNLSEMINTKIEKSVKDAGYGILLPEEKEKEELSIRFIL